MKARGLAGAAWAVLALTQHTQAAAQDDAQAQPVGQEVDDSAIVVTARLREESLLDVPEAITVFNEQAIDDAEIDEVADFAQLTPGVNVQQGFQGGDRPIIVFRGVGQIGGTAPSVVVLSDGVYLPAGDPLRNQLFDIERIEVIKGPQGALYGRDTIGGVINIITKSPSNDLEFGGRATYGAGNEYSVGGAIGTPIIADELFVRFSGSYLKSDGFFDNGLGDDQDTREEYFARGRLLWRPSSAVDVDLRVSANGYDNGYNSGFITADARTYVDDIGGALNVVDLADGFNKRDVIDAALKVTADLDFATLTSISQYVTSDQTLRQDADFGFTPGLQIARTSVSDYRALSQEVRLASPSDQAFRWLAGAFYEDNEVEFSTADVEILAGLGNLGGSSNITNGERIGVFGQLDIDVTDRLTLGAALRFDRDEQVQNVLTPAIATNRQTTEQTSPKISLTYEISDDVTAYASYGEGFRSGGFDAASALPFGAETLKSYEVGLKSAFLNGRVRAEIAAYHIEYSNQQVSVLITDPNTGNLITTTDNLGKSENRGVELSLAVQPTKGFDVFATFDYLDTKIVDDPNPALVGNQTPFRTELVVNAGAQYRWPLSDGLNLVLRSEYYLQGAQTWNKANTLVQPSYGLLSARAALEGDFWSLAVSGENILDEEFNDQIFEVAPGLNFTYPGLPARWRLTATVKY
ncbi:TonB-dependent receptor [Pacificimonas sp. WHA3]|uniref:TonB-dependent receptor n=1 Tax=Pacificimonas pallii TaxID=2827236 RepID=A0ABS6SAC8_9SPHN|nr:TonB-dependent receptor [Pacificimonas pallii]MBV7255329.1 TonB-dependent receptor [Pacificimonas pallii]